MEWISHVFNNCWVLSCQHYLACSTSFHEAILFGLSFIVKEAIQTSTLILYYAIFICVILASSSWLQVKHFFISLYIVVILVVIW